MSDPALFGAAIVVLVVASSMLNRRKRTRKPPAPESPGLAAFEALIEQRGGEGASTDLRELRSAARAANRTMHDSAAAGITIEIDENHSGPGDLGEILAAARERKHAREEPAPGISTFVATKQTAKTHQKKHRAPQAGKTPVAQVNGARPPLGALATVPPLPTLQAQAARAPLYAQSPLAAP